MATAREEKAGDMTGLVVHPDNDRFVEAISKCHEEVERRASLIRCELFFFLVFFFLFFFFWWGSLLVHFWFTLSKFTHQIATKS